MSWVPSYDVPSTAGDVGTGRVNLDNVVGLYVLNYSGFHVEARGFDGSTWRLNATSFASQAEALARIDDILLNGGG